MKITIQEIEKAISEIFEESEILSVNSVYEKNDDNSYKLVIFIHNFFQENVNVFYTKFIFNCDLDKINIEDKSFLYLYDINCDYVLVGFADIYDFKNQLLKIFNNNVFGDDIKLLSSFIKNPAFLINDWFKNNGVDELTVLNFKYQPKTYIIPCEFLTFNFVISIDNIEIELSLRKDDENMYVYDFIINNDNISVEKQNLNDLVETIGTTLKNNL